MKDNKLRAAITGVEAYLPPYILNNDELSNMVDTTNEWIMTRVGIQERHILKEPNVGMTFMAEKAVKQLLKNTGTDPSEIGAIICSTVTPDMVFPASASIIAHKCGIEDAMVFDLNAGCAGFIHAFKTMSLYIESGFCKKGIVVSGEMMSSITDYTNRNTCPLFGDGAAAVLVEGRTDGTGLQDTILRSNGIGGQHLKMEAGGSQNPPSHDTVDKKQHYIYQDGKNVFRWAVQKMADVSAEIMERNNLTPDDIAYLLPHQANIRIIDAVANRMGIDKDEKVLVNIEYVGNTSSATIPILMWEKKKLLKKGDNLILSAFGAGFSWGSLWIKWAI